MTEQEFEDAINDAPDAKFWMEEESEEQARERMSPAERAADEAYGPQPEEGRACGMCGTGLCPGERVVCDFCHGVQTREYNQ